MHEVSSSEEEEKRNWVECGACNKWRLLSVELESLPQGWDKAIRGRGRVWVERHGSGVERHGLGYIRVMFRVLLGVDLR